MLELRGVNAGYGTVNVVWDAHISVGQGEVASLVGRNGVGKSTTLKAVVGLADVSAGDIRIGDKPTRGLDTAYIVKSGVGYIAQEREICPALTVEENLRVPLYAKGQSPTRMEAIFTQFPRLKERARQKAGSLSGGERKLLAFGRIMLLEPQVYLIDEPTEGLMPSAIAEISALIRRLREQGAAILLVEQHLDLVRALSDRVYLMNAGRIEQCVDSLNDETAKRYLGL